MALDAHMIKAHCKWQVKAQFLQFFMH